MNPSLILPLWAIPDGTVVTLITGDAKYAVCRTLKVYPAKSVALPDELVSLLRSVSEAGVVFLISGQGSIGAHKNTKRVKITFESVDDLNDFVQTHLWDQKPPT